MHCKGLETKESIFSKKDILTGLMEKTIESEIKSRNFKFNNEVFYSCSITECERRIIYRANGVKSETAPSVMEAYSQQAVKNKWITFFSDSKKLKLIEKNLTVADCSVNLIGKVDGVLKLGDLLMIFMVHGLSSEEYNIICERGARRKQIAEIMINMWLAEIPHGIIIYENKNNNEFCFYHVEPYEPIIESVRKKCLNMINFKMLGIIPTQPYKNKESKECNMCEFVNTCWKQ